MCGLAGFAFCRNDLAWDMYLERMTDTLRWRGPDGSGLWMSECGSIGLGHRRLAILDLSSAGHQPMVSADGRYVVTYNGEIYNHLDLRRRLSEAGLAPERWSGHSDTETLLASIAAWGLEATLKRAVGMFAFALWDCKERSLSLARDRFGEKPLYAARLGKGVVFASELKALAALPTFPRDIDPVAQAAFLRHGYVPAPLCIYRGATKLLPGCYVTLREDDLSALPREGDFLKEVRCRYWRADLREEQHQSDDLDDAGEIDRLDGVLRAAVERQRISDVPLGAFLSGGIDSSLVVALMQSQSQTPIRTFTIGFEEAAFDETGEATAVARHLGTQHVAVKLSARDALDRIPLISTVWDEPFADASQLPTRLLVEVACRDVKVALSGDGGDEIFGGYKRYMWCDNLWSYLSRSPLPLRAAVAKSINKVPVSAWDAGLGGLALLTSAENQKLLRGDKLHKLADLLTASDPSDLFDRLCSAWPDVGDLLVEGASIPAHWAGSPDLPSFLDAMMFRDTVGYLPDDVMVKVDRAAMSVSLETRAPFLDPEVARFAWNLPKRMKVRDGTTKWILRQLLYRHVPAELVERPKRGFSVPINNWLRGPLRDWAEGLLREEALEDAGFRAAPIRQAWADHLSGRRDFQFRLWPVLMFQTWRENWGAAASDAEWPSLLATPYGRLWGDRTGS